MLRSVHPSVRLSVPFSDSTRSLDGDMRTSLFQTHSKEGSTGLCYQRGWAYRFASRYLVHCCSDAKHDLAASEIQWSCRIFLDQQHTVSK